MIGARLGPFRLASRLGSGGMGEVYLAETVTADYGLPAGGRVALKVIHPHLLDEPIFRSRFQREAEIGQAIHHPNVVRTHQVASAQHEGRELHFMIMEFVAGQTLRSLLIELGRVPEELCRHIGREVSKALAAIHAAGIVHRDLKPENVLITVDEVVKVMDLGVARLQDAALQLSQTGVFVGSVQYAAPEQFTGLANELDGRADLYALGTVLYELATGEHPFGLTVEFLTLVQRILNDTPRPVGHLNPQLSPFFEEVVNALVMKDRDDRVPSAGDLFAILNQGEEHPWWAERMRAIRLLTHRPLRRIRIPRQTGCYGREAEIERLQAIFLKARAGEGQAVLIEGEAGIGKTRLVDEFVGVLQRAGEDLNFLFGAYPPGGAATGAGAFSTAYREHFGEEDLEHSLAGYLKVTPLLIPAFAALLRGDQIPESVEPLTRDSLQAVFVHASRALAEERPTVILIDDLHFAPDEGRALFAALAMAVSEHRLLVVGTARRGTVGEWMGSLDRLPHVSRLALTRLHREDMDRLLGEAFRSPALVRELGEDIALKSDGNPFFLFEILRGLRESQLIKQRADGAWIKTQSIRQVAIPSSVRELFQARLLGLEEEDRDLLEMACCWGFEFDPSLVADALERGTVPVLKQCGRLELRTQLIRAAGRNYVFDHHQVQETLYESIFPQLRESYHASLATALATRERALERDPDELDGAVAVGLCEHFMKGARPAEALRYLLPALDHLERGYLNGAAVELADRALAVPGLITGGARIDLLLRRAERLDLVGRRADAGTTLVDAQALAEKHGDPILKARASCRYGGHLITTARYEEAQAALAAAIELARAAGDAREEGAATGNLGIALRALGRFEEAQALQERSLELAESAADGRREAIAHGNLGLVFLDRGDFDAARVHFERNLELAREVGHRQGEAIATGNLGMLDGALGRFEAARVHLERYMALARQIGYRQGEAIAAGNLGNALFELGRYADALEFEELFLALARDVGFRRGEAIALSDLGSTWAALGETHKARELESAAQTLSLEIGAKSLHAVAVHALASLAQQCGDFEEAIILYEKALAARRELGESDAIAGTLAAYGALLASQGRIDEARERFRECLTIARAGENSTARVFGAAQLAILGGEETPEVRAEALAAYADLEPRLGQGDQMSARYLLWQATGDLVHLGEAYRLLLALRDHTPPAYRDSLMRQVPRNHDILSAWRSHGALRTQVAGPANLPTSEPAPGERGPGDGFDDMGETRVVSPLPPKPKP